LSKIGISLLTSYCGAQIFEALGIGEEVINRKGTTSRIGGFNFEDIANETVLMFPEIDPMKMKLAKNVFHKPVPTLGEYHVNSSDLENFLHDAIGLDKIIRSENRDDDENDGVKP